MTIFPEDEAAEEAETGALELEQMLNPNSLVTLTGSGWNRNWQTQHQANAISFCGRDIFVLTRIPV